MWVYFKKQGVMIDFQPNVSIRQKDATWVIAETYGDVKYPVVTFADKASVEYFVAQFDLALRQRDPMLTYDEDKPRFTMKLSSEDMNTKPGEEQFDVGLE